MEWIKIERDKDGFATDECLNRMLKNTPVALVCGNGYEIISPEHDIAAWRGDIERGVKYTHYMVLPKVIGV